MPKRSSDHWQVELAAFRAAHQLQTRHIAGHEWEYFACGAGAELLLILPGGLAVADTAFRYIRCFEASYRIIAPTYPASATTMAELVHGLAQLSVGEPQVHVIGGSYSGLVAQCLVRHVPERIGQLVLSDTGLPRPARARQFGRYLPWLSRLPEPLLRGLLRLGVAAFLQPMRENRAFWRRYFTGRIASLTRVACVNHLATWRDFDGRYRFSAADLPAWRGRMLIIEAEHDRLFQRPEQLALRQLYPQAQIYTFENSQHGASLARMDDYIALIAQFLGAASRASVDLEHSYVEEYHASH